MEKVVERLAIQPINTQEIDPRNPFKNPKYRGLQGEQDWLQARVKIAYQIHQPSSLRLKVLLIACTYIRRVKSNKLNGSPLIGKRTRGDMKIM